MAKAQVYNYYCDMSKEKAPKENLVPLKIGEGRKAPTYDLTMEIAAQLQAGLTGNKPFKLVYMDGTNVEVPTPEPEPVQE